MSQAYRSQNLPRTTTRLYRFASAAHPSPVGSLSSSEWFAFPDPRSSSVGTMKVQAAVQDLVDDDYQHRDVARRQGHADEQVRMV